MTLKNMPVQSSFFLKSRDETSLRRISNQTDRLVDGNTHESSSLEVMKALQLVRLERSSTASFLDLETPNTCNHWAKHTGDRNEKDWPFSDDYRPALGQNQRSERLVAAARRQGRERQEKTNIEGVDFTTPYNIIPNRSEIPWHDDVVF